MNICEDCPYHISGSSKCCHQSITPVPAKLMSEAVSLNQQIHFEQKYWGRKRWSVPTFIKELAK